MSNKNENADLNSNESSTIEKSVELVYCKDNIWLYCGDNVELMKTVPDNVIDLTVTSPPYDDLRTYTKEAAWNWEKFCEVAKELYRITKDGGVVVWVVGDETKKGSETGNSFRQALYFKDECGFNLHDTMIYAKDAISFPDKNRYQNAFEFMFIFSKGKPTFKNLIHDRKNISFGRKVTGTDRQKDGTTRKASCYGNDIKEFGCRWNIWEICSDKGNNITGHPAMYPESLAHDHILSWSNENDLVFDPFHGSGTTGKMCKKLNRKFFGIDIAREYIDIQIERIDCFEKASDHD